MKLKPMYGDMEKSQLLLECLTATTHSASNLPALPPDLQAQLATLATQFSEAQLHLVQQREQFKLHNQSFRRAESQLRLLIRHAWHAVKRRHQSETLPTALILSFGLRADATQPSSMRNIKTPEEVAKGILSAHERAIHDHYWILIDPSPASFQAALEATSQARIARAQARSEEWQAFAAIQQMRQQVDVLIAQIKTYLRMRFQGQPVEGLRKALRACGFKFIGTASEPNVAEAGEALQATTPEAKVVEVKAEAMSVEAIAETKSAQMKPESEAVVAIDEGSTAGEVEAEAEVESVTRSAAVHAKAKDGANKVSPQQATVGLASNTKRRKKNRSGARRWRKSRNRKHAKVSDRHRRGQSEKVFTSRE